MRYPLHEVIAVSSLVLAVQPVQAQIADITHQEIQDAVKYPTTGGPINGKYAYAWGSYTCNIGDAPLLWQNAGTPALAMNAYRLHDGRMMQIGLGFAKHACCVANGSGCGTCQAGPAGTLRPGCRDIYSAGFNGGQGRLGPRSGINAYDTTFSTIPAGTGDALWRRVQVTLADMDAVGFAGARYFAEGVYVCAEETFDQSKNNATYRPMNVANTGATPTYNWTVTGATASGKPAIVAWQEHGLGLNMPDPDVKVVIADIPDEGRFYAAGKVRDLSGTGAGPWRFDYAVFNLNSHRSGSSFSVPVPANATLTNIGFHSPDYHSGEPYDNTDWTATRCFSSLTWRSPADFATDPNTNALRWGTMYNFWFTSNVPPSPSLGSATLGIFRPGTYPSIQASGLPLVATPACPSDFNASGATSVQDVFDFIEAYFDNREVADMNCNNTLSIQDLFEYLAVYFTPCN